MAILLSILRKRLRMIKNEKKHEIEQRRRNRAYRGFSLSFPFYGDPKFKLETKQVLDIDSLDELFDDKVFSRS